MALKENKTVLLVQIGGSEGAGAPLGLFGSPQTTVTTLAASAPRESSPSLLLYYSTPEAQPSDTAPHPTHPQRRHSPRKMRASTRLSSRGFRPPARSSCSTRRCESSHRVAPSTAATA
eukprot:COSAG05_NODE_3105_length_2320_cov_1.261594_2_plen_118_part_00